MSEPISDGQRHAARCDIVARVLCAERNSYRVGTGAVLFALGGDIQNVLDTDASVTASGKPPEGEHAILAEPIHVLTGYPHEVSGLGRRKLLLGAHHHDPRPVSDGIEHRAHRSLDRAIAVQALRETLRVGADGRVNRIEGGSKKCVRFHGASLAPTAIMTTVNLGIGQSTLNWGTSWVCPSGPDASVRTGI